MTVPPLQTPQLNRPRPQEARYKKMIDPLTGIEIIDFLVRDRPCEVLVHNTGDNEIEAVRNKRRVSWDETRFPGIYRRHISFHWTLSLGSTGIWCEENNHLRLLHGLSQNAEKGLLPLRLKFAPLLSSNSAKFKRGRPFQSKIDSVLITESITRLRKKRTYLRVNRVSLSKQIIFDPQSNMAFANMQLSHKFYI